MSSPRKRSALTKAHAETERLRERLILEEHHNTVLSALAESAIRQRDALVLAVRCAFLGETRYETALRYIQEREALTTKPGVPAATVP